MRKFSALQILQIRRIFDWFAKFALFFFGIALWSNGLTFFSYYFLVSAWILDGGLSRLLQTLREPLILSILILCIVLALGIIWSKEPALGVKVWRRYFAFLTFIPFLSLLNKDRLGWAMTGLLIGYFSVLLITIFQWITTGVTGIPIFNLPYTSFSAVLGIGIIMTVYLIVINNDKKWKLILWIFAIFLLHIQFDQGARGALLATFVSLILLLLMYYKVGARILLTAILAGILLTGLFTYNSESFQQRLIQAKKDIELTQRYKFDSSLGYRLALWDVGLHGLVESPIFGHGTGMAAGYFDETIETYKNGRYKDIREFATTYHYHNDWIEIGMHVGVLGLLAYAFFLWAWFQSLKKHKRTILGASIVCFFFFLGLTDTVVFYRRTFYLLFAITAIAIGWERANGIKSFPEKTAYIPTPPR